MFGSQKKFTRRKKILDFIENNSKKTKFINWLNTQYDVAFSGKSDWKEITDRLLHEEYKSVSNSALQTFAASLSSDEDIKKLLQDVEEETKKAQEVVHRLSYLSKFKRFTISVGGAIFSEGIIFLLFSAGIFLNQVDLGSGSTEMYIGVIALVLGAVNVIGGLLLSSR